MKRYEKYKDSEIEWLGEIPEHWEVRRVKDILKNAKHSIKTGPFGSQLKGNDLLDKGDFCVYTQRNVLDNDFNQFKYFVSKSKANQLASFSVKPKDILITTRGTIGKAAIVPQNMFQGILHPCLIVLRLNNKLINKKWFLHYINDSDFFGNYIKENTTTTTIEVVYTNTLNNFILFLPPIQEQTQIAHYLDSKTQAIDQKINLLQQKIQHYQVLRKSLINETVCRGLDKTVTLKDSGIEWIGEIPEHWEVSRIKDIVFKIGSGVTPKGGQTAYSKTGIPFLRSQNVYDDGIRLENVAFIDETIHSKMKSSQLKPNDVLINITGASIGRSCIVPQKLKSANINQHIIFLRIKKMAFFISYYFKTNTIKEHINLIQAGTSKEALNMGQLLEIPVIVPPHKEQNTIVDFLNRKTQQIDQILQNLQNQIKTLQALRKTLINDVVTGKIKV